MDLPVEVVENANSLIGLHCLLSKQLSTADGAISPLNFHDSFIERCDMFFINSTFERDPDKRTKKYCKKVLENREHLNRLLLISSPEFGSEWVRILEKTATT